MLVSIVMPCYNASITILEAVESVIKQTYTNWELLIVDDCSTDESVSLVSAVANRDIRIKVFVLDSNTGSPSGPRNFALKHSRGEYISFLDADDLWEAQKLAKQVEFMNKYNVSFSCTGYKIINDKGEYLSSFIPPKLATYKSLLVNNTVGCLTAMVRKDLLKNQFFPECGHEDFALWLKLLRNDGQVHGIQSELAAYRKVSGSVSSNKLRVAGYFWNVYRNQEYFGLVRSTVLCFQYLVNVLVKYK